MGKCNEYVNKYGKYHYFVFRIVVGLMFLLHGYGKLWGPKAAQLASLMGIAGVVEFTAGLGILLGFWTRLAATGGAITMLVALFKVHFPQGIIPLANGGELAVLYLLSFLVLTIYGNGKWNLEKYLLKKETF